MRIISGQWRSRKLAAPPSRTTRPMTDRVREALFDILGSRLGTPGGLPPLAVLDLFAGSGSLGLEALSRGAESCVFVEKDPRAIRTLRGNVADLEASEQCVVVQADAWRENWRRPIPTGFACSLVFLDPPYADARDVKETGKVTRLLASLLPGDLLSPDGLIVLHLERRIRHPDEAYGGWGIADRREYGSTAICLLARPDSA